MNLTRCVSVVALSLGLVLAPLGLAAAQEALVGSWVLDPAASTAPQGMAATAGTLEIKAAGGGQFTSVGDSTVAGMNMHTEITFSVDGKDYAVTVTPAMPGTPAITQSIERVSDGVYKSSIKVGGQEFATAVTELSADGKTVTQTSTGVGQFAAISSTTVYRRK